MPLIRQFIEVQSELRTEALSKIPENKGKFKLKGCGDDPSFRVVTYNVCPVSVLLNEGQPLSNKGGRHFKWKERKRLFLKELQKYKPDLLCLQEILGWEDNGQWKELLGDLGYEYAVYATTKPRPTLSYSANGTSRNLYGQAIAWKRDKFRLVAYEPFFFDKAPQSHPTDITPFTGGMVQYAMLEYLYAPPPPDNSSSHGALPYDIIHYEEDPYSNLGFDDEEYGEEGEISAVKDDGEVTPSCATYAFKAKKSGKPRFAVFVANTKLLDMPEFDYSRLRMFYVMLSQLETFQATHQAPFCRATKLPPSNFPHVLCGDFGFLPQSPIYHYLLNPSEVWQNVRNLASAYDFELANAEAMGHFQQASIWTSSRPSSGGDRHYSSQNHHHYSRSHHHSRYPPFPFSKHAHASNGRGHATDYQPNTKQTTVAPIENQLTLDVMRGVLPEMCYRFHLRSVYHNFQHLARCYELEMRINSLRQEIEKKAAKEWDCTESTFAMDPPEQNQWGTSTPSALPVAKASRKIFVEPIYPNESADRELLSLKEELAELVRKDTSEEQDGVNGEPLFTRFMHSKLETSDYIFYSGINSLSIEGKKQFSKDKEVRVEIFPTSLLNMPAEAEVKGGIPNEVFPSDHLCLAAEFSVIFHSV